VNTHTENEFHKRQWRFGSRLKRTQKNREGWGGALIVSNSRVFRKGKYSGANWPQEGGQTPLSISTLKAVTK